MATYRYSDFDLDFLAHPITGDLVRKYDNNSIKQSLKNLVLMRPHETPFMPAKSSTVAAYLFELLSPDTAIAIQDSIKQVIKNLEPRVEVQDVSAYADIDNNGYQVTILYNIVNVPDTERISFLLKRLR